MELQERFPLIATRDRQTIVEGSDNFQNPSDHDSVRFSWHRLLFCLLVLILGTLAAAMGIFAEYYSSKDIAINRHDCHCDYPGDFVISLCTYGAVFLAVAQFLVNVFGFSASHHGGRYADDRRLCRDSQASSKINSNVKNLVISWIFCMLALYYFSSGERVRETNKAHEHQRDGMCTAVKELVFVKGGALSLLATDFGLAFYLAQCALKDTAAAKLESTEGIPQAQPLQASEAYPSAMDPFNEV